MSLLETKLKLSLDFTANSFKYLCWWKNICGIFVLCSHLSSLNLIGDLPVYLCAVREYGLSGINWSFCHSSDCSISSPAVIPTGRYKYEPCLLSWTDASYSEKSWCASSQNSWFFVEPGHPFNCSNLWLHCHYSNSINSAIRSHCFFFNLEAAAELSSLNARYFSLKLAFGVFASCWCFATKSFFFCRVRNFKSSSVTLKITLVLLVWWPSSSDQARPRRLPLIVKRCAENEVVLGSHFP